MGIDTVVSTHSSVSLTVSSFSILYFLLFINPLLSVSVYVSVCMAVNAVD